MGGELAGRVAIVTGGGWNIGRAIARRFAAAGARVVVTSRRADRLQETVRLVEAEGGEALAVAADLTDLSQVEAVAARTLETYGRIDVLAAIAGGGAVYAPIDQIDPAAWEQCVRQNLVATFYCARAVIREMKKRDFGHILTCSGGGGSFPLLGMHATAYACAKAAICRFTDQLQAELLDTGIHVNCIEPGLVWDPDRMAEVEAEERRTGRPHPLRGQNRSPEEAAELALWIVARSEPQVRGRVISVCDDWWKDPEQVRRVEQTIHLYRVRRYDL